MVAKKVFIAGSLGVLISATILFFSAEKFVTSFIPEQKSIENKVEKTTISNNPIKKEAEIKYDLYSSCIYDLPFTSIMDVSKLPLKVKQKIDSILETAQGFYYLKYFENEKRIFIILQNSISEKNTYSRHNLEFVELFIEDSSGNIEQKTYSPLFSGNENEISNSLQDKDDELWIFDESIEPYRPKKHITYNERGKTKFVELWNYDSNEEIKYVLKDSRKKTVSMFKEKFEGDSSYRQEHLLYDKEGNVVMSLCINYDGANITRIMFYDFYNPENSINIVSKYDNGIKIEESIYNTDYQKIYTLRMNYIDNTRKELFLLDKDDNIIKKIAS